MISALNGQVGKTARNIRQKQARQARARSVVSSNIFNDFGSILSGAEVSYGINEIGLSKLANTTSNSQISTALKGTSKVVGKFSKGAGIAGYGFQAATTGSKIVSGQSISTAEKVGFGVSTVIVGAAYFAAGTAAAPFVAGAALIYGAGQLGSYLYNGKTLEENYFKK